MTNISPTPCQHCGFDKTAHTPGSEACSQYIPPGEAWVALPDCEPSPGPDSPRAAWSPFDPARHTIWLTVPRPEWTFAFRLVLRDGAFPVAEVRVYPSEQADPGAPVGVGEWSGEPDSVPEGGITSAVVRATPLNAVRDNTHRLLKEIEKTMGAAALLDLFGSRDLPADTLSVIAQSPHRAASTHEPQVRAAALYEENLRAGHHAPVEKVAEQMCLSRGRVRDLLHEARRNGYLTKARHGIAEGQLTPKGVEYLRSLDGQKPGP